MPRETDRLSTARDFFNADLIGLAGQGLDALLRRDEEAVAAVFRRIRRMAMDCNAARNADREPMLPCVKCRVWDRAFRAGQGLAEGTNS